MSLEGGLQTYLLTLSAITDLIGGTVNSARMHAVRLPQRPKFPAVTLQRISAPRGYAHDGPHQITDVRVQFDCWAKTHDEAQALAEQIRIALSGYVGTVGSETVRACFLSNERHTWNDRLEIHRRSMDFEVTHEEAQS